MKSWIITGGVATGKSSFSQMLVDLTDDKVCLFFSCDDEAKRLWGQPEVVSEIGSALGNRVKNQQGNLDRDLIRKLVSSDAVARKALEGVLHPRILSELEVKQEEAVARKAKVFLAEVPLYYEIQSSIMADSVIVVAASRTVQVNRLMVRQEFRCRHRRELAEGPIVLGCQNRQGRLGCLERGH